MIKKFLRRIIKNIMDDERKLYVLTDLYTHETFARNTFTDEEVERLNNLILDMQGYK